MIVVDAVNHVRYLSKWKLKHDLKLPVFKHSVRKWIIIREVILWGLQVLLLACLVNGSAHLLHNLSKSLIIVLVQICDTFLPRCTGSDGTPVIRAAAHSGVHGSTEPVLEATSGN